MTISLDDARRLPKVVLHDHLDGGLRLATIIELADEIGWTLPATDLDALQAWFTRGAETGDLLQYLATFEHTLAVLQTTERSNGSPPRRSSISPPTGWCTPRCGSRRSCTSTVARPRGGRRGGHVRVPARRGGRCVGRQLDHGERDPVRDAHRAPVGRDRPAGRRAARHDDKVVAFDLAGAETGFPPSLHADALEFARAKHLNITIHASEPPDLELISDALAHGAHRIGHGVRLLADTTTDS